MKFSPRTIAYVIAAAVVLLVVFSSCVTPRKAADVLSRPKNEQILAELCSTRFPVKDSIIKGDSVVRYDTLWGVVTDTVTGDPQVLVYTDTVRVPKLVTKTITIRDTVIRENTAKTAVLNNWIAALQDVNLKQSETIDELTARRDGYKKQRDKWLMRFIVLCFSIGIVYFFKVKTTKKFW